MYNEKIVYKDRDYQFEILNLVREGLSAEDLRARLDDYHSNDIASVLHLLSEEQSSLLIASLGTERMSDVISYLDEPGEYLKKLDTGAAADIIESMDADDALLALDDLDEKTRTTLIDLIEDEEVREEIELLDSYSDKEFGSRMSTNFIVISRNTTIKGAMRALVAEAAENDNIHTVFVTNEDGTFYGAIDLKDLIIARSNEDIENLISTAFPCVSDKDIIADKIEWLKGYSEELIPVLSSKSNALLGVITAQDITELVDELLGDDYAKLAALSSEEGENMGILASMKKRVPWLIILLFMGLFVSCVVGLFEGVVAELPVIVAFQSLILGMAGNVGTQSLAVTVRALSASDAFTAKTRWKLIFKETRVALFNGFAVGLLSFALVFLYLFLSDNIGLAASTAGCVGLSMCFAMTISGFTGAAIPMGLYRAGADPAVASGPLITTVNDLVAVISYYGLAWLLLINIL